MIKSHIWYPQKKKKENWISLKSKINYPSLFFFFSFTHFHVVQVINGVLRLSS